MLAWCSVAAGVVVMKVEFEGRKRSWDGCAATWEEGVSDASSCGRDCLYHFFRGCELGRWRNFGKEGSKQVSELVTAVAWWRRWMINRWFCCVFFERSFMVDRFKLWWEITDHWPLAFDKGLASVHGQLEVLDISDAAAGSRKVQDVTSGESLVDPIVLVF